MGYGKCPRCGCLSLEHLKTHSHCWECNYSPDDEVNHLQFNASAGDTTKRFDNEDDDDHEEMQDDEQDCEAEEGV